MSSIRFIAQRPDYPEADPFRGDTLGRADTARNLTAFLDTFVDQPFTLGLNGIWGSGKTHFIERWQAKLQQDGYQTLRFNAWENDFADDPFAALLGEFRQLASDKEEIKSYQKLLKAGLPVLKRVAAGAVKNLTLGIVEFENKDMENLVAGVMEGAASHAIAKCEQQRDNIRDFRVELEAFVQKQATPPSKPIYYFIDELDRCRPTFAISVLERVKHLLQVKGIVFIFAWDRLQLNSTIQTVYGHQTSVNGYLLRFVDLEYDLPRGSTQNLIKQLLERHNLRDFLLHNDREHELTELENHLELYVGALALSIRELEKTITLLAIHIRMLPKKRMAYMDLACFLATVRIKSPDFYKVIRDVTDEFHNMVADKLPRLLGWETWNSEELGYIEGYLIFHFDKAKNTLKAAREVETSVRSLSLAEHDFQGDRHRALMQSYNHLTTQQTRKSAVSMVVHGLEFAGGFV